jgi:hypothetical protein
MGNTSETLRRKIETQSYIDEPSKLEENGEKTTP